VKWLIREECSTTNDGLFFWSDRIPLRNEFQKKRIMIRFR
jgi:hypothetical protein